MRRLRFQRTIKERLSERQNMMICIAFNFLQIVGGREEKSLKGSPRARKESVIIENTLHIPISTVKR